jgi:hypothetical protein
LNHEQDIISAGLSTAATQLTSSQLGALSAMKAKHQVAMEALRRYWAEVMAKSTAIEKSREEKREAATRMHAKKNAQALSAPKKRRLEQARASAIATERDVASAIDKPPNIIAPTENVTDRVEPAADELSGPPATASADPSTQSNNHSASGFLDSLKRKYLTPKDDDDL